MSEPDDDQRGTWVIRVEGGPALAASMKTMLRIAAARVGGGRELLPRLETALDQAEFTPPGTELWTWTLATNANESAAELWRDGVLKLTVPLSADQVEVLMDKPISLFGVLGGDGS